MCNKSVDKKLECGHPIQCLADLDDPETCAWCAEVQIADHRVQAMADAAGKIKIIVNGGVLLLDKITEIGIIEVHGGKVGHILPKDAEGPFVRL